MFVLWIFIHDDMYDMPEGEVSSSTEVAHAHMTSSLDYMRRVLDFQTEFDNPGLIPSVESPDSTIELFGAFATRIRSEIDTGMFRSNIHIYICPMSTH
jgi:hypothetical protein